MTENQLYASTVFFKAAIPLLKVVANEVPALGNKFKNKTFTLQLSAHDGKEKYATHFEIENGEWQAKPGVVHENPTIELSFPNIDHFIKFMAGKTKKLPKLKGVKNLGTFVSVMRLLLKMASLLQAKNLPKKEEDRKLLVKLYFYLLSAGISRLNKAGHKEIHEWALKSPDRVYAFQVDGEEDLAAWIRVKAGNSRAGRGKYERCMPFFCLRFSSIEYALDILLQKGDMLEYTKASKLIMDGAPEFGAQLGSFMMTIAAYAK